MLFRLGPLGKVCAKFKTIITIRFKVTSRFKPFYNDFRDKKSYKLVKSFGFLKIGGKKHKVL